MPLHAIVLAGGRAQRLGGVDKLMFRVDGSPLLSRVVAALHPAARIVVVGPDRDVDLPREVTWAREDPPFGGPAAAVAAGLAALDPDPDDEVLVVPGDLVRPSAVVAALGSPGTIATDPDGRRQWACVRLRAADLAAAVTAAGDVSGQSLRRLFGSLDLDEAVLTHDACADLDTFDDAREYTDEHR